jgi:hypothetical protein
MAEPEPEATEHVEAAPISLRQSAASKRLAARLAKRQADRASGGGGAGGGAGTRWADAAPALDAGHHELVRGLVPLDEIRAASAAYCALVDAEGSETMEYGGAAWKASRTYADGGGALRDPRLAPIFAPLLRRALQHGAGLSNGRPLLLESAFATLYDATHPDQVVVKHSANVDAHARPCP